MTPKAEVCDYADPSTHHSSLIRCKRFNINVRGFRISLPIKTRTTISDVITCFNNVKMSFISTTQVYNYYETFRKFLEGYIRNLHSVSALCLTTRTKSQNHKNGNIKGNKITHFLRRVEIIIVPLLKYTLTVQVSPCDFQTKQVLNIKSCLQF